MENLNSFLKYFHFIEFLRGKKVAYLIIINLINLSIILLIIVIIGIALNINQKKIIFNSIILDILKVIIPLFSMSFFGQIFHALLTPNKCFNNCTFYDLNQKCNEGFLFYFQEVISIIALILLSIMALFTISVYYIPILFKGNNIIKKVSSVPEQVFFFNKILIFLLFHLEDYLKENNNNLNVGLMIVILSLFTGFNAYFSFVYNNYENKKILLINNILSFLLFWGFFSLLIGIIFINIENFDNFRLEFLFLIGALLIIFYRIYYNNQYQNEYWQNINYLYTNQERLNYILKFIDIVEKRNDCRKNKIILKSLIEKIELYCINPHCKIKQYMYQLKKGNDSNILLYEYCQQIFKLTISKNKNDITAQIYYIIFVIKKLNRRNKAQILLKKLEDRQLVLFQDLFNIYRVKKLIEDTNLNFEEEIIYNNNMLTFAQYNKYTKKFKNMLYKTSSLYLNFWTLLLNSHKIEIIDNLHNTGKEIKDLVNEIEDTFNKMHNFRSDIKIIKLYTKFLKNVLKDKKLYEKYHKNKNTNIILEFGKFNKDEDYINYDINKLKESDESQWILVSADEKNYGTILNISLGICPIIGYKRNEIIGNNINVLLPNIYHKNHDYMLHKLFYDVKHNFYDILSKNIEYKPEIINKSVYCKNKSKFLVHFPFRSFFVQTEEGELIFIMNVLKHKCFPHSNKNDEDQLCCVLTDKHFIIQTFTPNAFDYLGLNSNDIDSGLNITTCISQFGNDVFSSINDRENTLEKDTFNYSSEINFEITGKNFYNANTIKSEKKLKRDLTKKEYSKPQLISWRYNHMNINNKNNNFIKLYSRLSSDVYEIRKNNGNIIDKKLMLQIKESKINNNIIGYKFLFKKKKIGQREVLKKTNYNDLSEYMESGISEISNINDINHNFNINNLNSSIPSLQSNRRESIKKYDSSLTLLKNERPLIRERRRHSQEIFLQIDLNNFLTNFKVEPDFVPNNKSNFIFDLSEMSYIYHNKITSKKDNTLNNNNEDTFLDKIIQEAKEKILFLGTTFNNETTKKTNNSANTELISDSVSNSSYSESNSNSNQNSGNDSSYAHTFSLNNISIGEHDNEELKNNKHFYSFMIQKDHKSQGNVSTISNYKNKTQTSKSNFNKRSLKESSTLYEKISNQIKEKKKMHFNYYEVNLKNIRFLKYDFYKEMIIEDKHVEKTSKMTEIINELKSNSKYINKDENYPTINTNHIIQIKQKENNKINRIINKIKKIEPEKAIDIKKIILSKNEKQNEKKIDKEKRIDEALNKKDKQHSIKNFIIISILCLLLLYAIGGINLYIYIDQVSKDKENIKLICDSSNLKFYFNLAVYFIRELTLLNIKKISVTNGEYIGYPSYNKTNYISKISKKILELYSYIHKLNEEIISSELPLSKNTTYYLNDKEYIIETLSNDFHLIDIRASLSNSIIILDAYLFNLIELTSIEQNHEDVFPFIYNKLNEIGELLNIQIELYMKELDLRGNYNKIKVIVSLVIVLVILIFIFFIISKAYSSVLKNKANYFYIFYGIKEEEIRLLIYNCEIFIQKLKEDINILNKNIEEDKNEENEEESSFLNEKINPILKSVITDNNELNYNITSPHKRKGVINKLILNQNDKQGKKEAINYRFNIKIFKLGFIFFCLIILIYIFIIINDYISFVSLISEYALYNYHLQIYHNDIIELLNGYREYLFDENSIINGLKANDYINDKINKIYISKFRDNIIFTKYRKKIPGFLEIYNEFHDQKLCSRRNDEYFKSEEECEKHMEGISTFGLSVVQTSMTEEIRIYKNMINQFLKNNSIIGNLTIYGSKYWNEDEIIYDLNNRNTSRVYFRLFLFNNNSYHKDLNILFINVIYPYLNTERNITINSIIEGISKKDIEYIIYFSCFLGGITLLFLIYWLPMIKNMNLTIYKTKKMLSIIPIQILASQNNINSLLNLDDTKYKLNDNNS